VAEMPVAAGRGKRGKKEERRMKKGKQRKRR
jgi:hypothetical protein